ncbi:outer membrane beta-barrel protein [Brumimicrobium mesophilum]|uniref:outer membrane beta-barrel protein n=1 Tax=Brumimicrobium mesophilum TaxID=392717 RepID=UPI000D1442D5|nr:outer membrane beta-barrel protein [Brumimicrobium mesophilum]
MKNTALITLLLFSTTFLFSQSDNSITDRKLNFGFNIGTNYSMLQPETVHPSNYEVSNGFGLNMGILMDYAISKNFIFSPKAELAFNNSYIEIINGDGSRYEYDLLPITLNFMTHFKYKISRKKAEPYLFIGPNLNIPLQNKPELNTAYQSGYNFAIDIGLGLENTFSYFIFAPELKYSYGLISVNQNPSLKSVYFHSIGLCLNFK